MRRLLTATLVSCVACMTNVQQHSAFGTALVVPDAVDGHVGDVLRFELRPPVAAGTNWILECHGRTRFADDPLASAIEWTAESRPIHMETVVSPWDPIPGHVRAAARGWLWYGLLEHGESEALDRDLPIHRLEYKQIAPVTFSSVVSLRDTKGRMAFREQSGRVYVTYLTPVDFGVPMAPSVDAMLVETGGKRVLYAEVKTDFGTMPKEKTGFEVTLSYDARVPAPVEVVVVGWVGHGNYYAPFTVDRLLVDGPAASDASPAPAAPTAG